MAIQIRSAVESDVLNLARFNQAMAWETEQKRLQPETIQQGVSSFLQRPDYGFYLVAELDSRVVGCLMVTYEWSDWRNGLFWWIQSVYVEPDCRRQGVFRALYAHVLNGARNTEGVCGIRLYVEQDNLTAQTTYKQLGMQETHYRLFETVLPTD